MQFWIRLMKQFWMNWRTQWCARADSNRWATRMHAGSMLVVCDWPWWEYSHPQICKPMIKGFFFFFLSFVFTDNCETVTLFSTEYPLLETNAIKLLIIDLSLGDKKVKYLNFLCWFPVLERRICIYF